MKRKEDDQRRDYDNERNNWKNNYFFHERLTRPRDYYYNNNYYLNHNPTNINANYNYYRYESYRKNNPCDNNNNYNNVSDSEPFLNIRHIIEDGILPPYVCIYIYIYIIMIIIIIIQDNNKDRTWNIKIKDTNIYAYLQFNGTIIYGRRLYKSITGFASKVLEDIGILPNSKVL